MELEKTIYMADLFSIYKTLLTQKQVKICELFYLNNLGLSEIAENLKISRQAVLDAVNKVNAELTNLENKLHLKVKFDKLTNLSSGELKDEIVNIING